MTAIHRTTRLLAASGAAGGLLLLGAAPALAAVNPPDPANGTVNGSAFGASATALGTVVDVPPTPQVTLPPSGAAQSATAVPINLPGILTTGVLTASTSGNRAAGTSQSQGKVANVQVLPPLLGGLGGIIPIPGLPGLPAVTTAALTADAVQADCTATPSGETGSTTIANLQLGAVTTPPTVDVTNLAPNTKITLQGIATIVLNEQINNPDGSLTVNAVHVTLLSTQGADIILGSATCGPNLAAPVAPGTPAFPTAGLPIAGGIVAIAAIGTGAWWFRRRNASTPMSA